MVSLKRLFGNIGAVFANKKARPRPRRKTQTLSPNKIENFTKNGISVKSTLRFYQNKNTNTITNLFSILLGKLIATQYQQKINTF